MKTRLRSAVLGLALASLLGAGCTGDEPSSNPSTDLLVSDIGARLVSPVEDSRRTTLPEVLSPRIRTARDLGRLDGERVLHGVSLVCGLTARAQGELDRLLAEQQTPTSSSFHRWLSPEEYAERFGLSIADISQIDAWLASYGLTVERSSRSRTRLFFSGTVNQIERTFRTELHRYESARWPGETHFAMSTPPSIPSAFASAVVDLRGLADFHAKPASHVRPPVTRPAGSEPATDFTDGSHGIAPEDFAKIYGVDKLYAAGIDGTGAKIAVVERAYYVPSDIVAFRQAVALTSANIQEVLVPSSGTGQSLTGADPGDIQEAELDLEWAGAVAKNATVVYVYTGTGGVLGVEDARAYAIDQNLAPFLSESYGGCESNNPAAYATSEEDLTKQANAQGITVFISAGDWGAAGCDTAPGETAASQGLAVDFPASIPEVTAVGGTEFNEESGTYWSANNDPGLGSVLSYIPEVAWNDLVVLESMKGATGGGVSGLFAKPTWQAGVGVPADGRRDVPDVALAASWNHDSYVTYYSPAAGVTTAGTYKSGGTSAASPTFAAIMTLLNEATNSGGLGNINPMLYALAASTPSPFHDITSGNNEAPCTPATPSCPTTAPYEFGYSAGVGYDLATGLGSVDAFALVAAWESKLLPTQTSLASTVTAPPIAGVAFTVTATVTTNSAAPAPSGFVTFYNGSVVLGTTSLSVAATGANSDYVGTAATTVTLPGGSYPLTARYSGNAHYAYSAGGSASPVVVGAWVTTTTLGALPVDAPEGLGFSATISSAAPATLAPLTGMITFYSGATALGSAPLIPLAGADGSPGATATIATSVAPTGSDTITARYTGDGNYLASTSGPGVVMVDGTLVLSPSPAASPPGGQVAFTGTGGLPPFVWTLQSNASGGTIDSTSGAYVAGAIPSVTDVVQATDSVGFLVTVNVSVGPGVTVSPANASVAAGGTISFTAAGGSAMGFLWSVQSLAGSQINSAGLYTAGSVGDVTDIVVATDPLGNVGNAVVMVTAGVVDAGAGADARATLDGGVGGVPDARALVFPDAGGTLPLDASDVEDASAPSPAGSSGGCNLGAAGDGGASALSASWLLGLALFERRRRRSEPHV